MPAPKTSTAMVDALGVLTTRSSHRTSPYTAAIAATADAATVSNGIIHSIGLR